jgi:hypothetical protein
MRPQSSTELLVLCPILPAIDVKNGALTVSKDNAIACLGPGFPLDAPSKFNLMNPRGGGDQQEGPRGRMALRGIRKKGR